MNWKHNIIVFLKISAGIQSRLVISCKTPIEMVSVTVVAYCIKRPYFRLLNIRRPNILQSDLFSEFVLV